jgi:hypothetical protein
MAQYSFPNRIQIGDLSLDSISLEIIDIGHISAYFGFPIHGIIGADLLQNYVVETDILHRKILFYDQDSFRYMGAGVKMETIDLGSGLFAVPLSFIPKGRKESITLPLKFDTACGDHLIFHNYTVREHQLSTRKKYKIVQGFGADSTLTKNLRAKLSSVSFADQYWRNVPVVFEVDPNHAQEKGKNMAAGLLGQRILLEFNITYDLSNTSVYLQHIK